LIGQAAAHGIMYGDEDRERILYLHQALDKTERFGSINDKERDFVIFQAIHKGGRQIREAERYGKISADAAYDAQHLLSSAVHSLVARLFSNRSRYWQDVSRDNEEWDR